MGPSQVSRILVWIGTFRKQTKFYDWVCYLEGEMSVTTAVINAAAVAHINQDMGCLAILWFGCCPRFCLWWDMIRQWCCVCLNSSW